MIVSKRMLFTQIQTKTPLAYRLLRAYDTFNALTKHFEVRPMCFMMPYRWQSQSKVITS
jgi:hypothetical protein